jgi:hypothetical protein
LLADPRSKAQWHLIPSIFLGMFMKEFGVLNQSQVEGLEQLLASSNWIPT